MIFGALCAVALFFLVRTWMNAPQRAERQFVQALEVQDWRSIYDQSPPGFFASTGVSGSQFNSLMSDLAKDVPQGYFAAATIEEAEVSVNEPSRGEHYVLLTLPQAPVGSAGTENQFLLHASRTREGWVLAPDDLPMLVLRMRSESRPDKWRILLDALTRAHIETYPITSDGLVLDRKKLAKFVSGELSKPDVYSHR